MKLNILVIAAHPDDAELACGGTIISHIHKGYKVGVIDLTRGELGTRGNPEIRMEEAKKAAEIMGLHMRHNLGFADGFFTNDKSHQFKVITEIRKYKPDIIITNPLIDRHPDHGKAGHLVSDSNFLSGLEKIETIDENGEKQEPWRAKQLYHFIQFVNHEPDIVVDVSDFIDKKFEAIMAYQSQFNSSYSDEPETILTNPAFIAHIKGRSLDTGFRSYIPAGEGFIAQRKPAVKDIFCLH
jgi:N-acetylglucosamine malate deacetylase 1